MNETRPTAPPPHWIEALDRAESDFAAGRVYDGEAVRQRLRDSIGRMQARTDVKVAQDG
jgi:hypothetical protein